MKTFAHFLGCKIYITFDNKIAQWNQGDPGIDALFLELMKYFNEQKTVKNLEWILMNCVRAIFNIKIYDSRYEKQNGKIVFNF